MKNLIRAISEDGGVVISAIDSTGIVHEMEKIHKTSAVVSAALGRLLTGASLMGSFLKNQEDSLTLRVNGAGPIGNLVTVSDSYGNVRGYADHPVVEIPLRADGKLDVGTAVGCEGTLAVIRDFGTGEPYVGQIPLVSGEIAEDITSYYATSEQTPTVCALGVLVGKDLQILNAGGFLLQLLPGATEAEISKIENNLKNAPSVTEFYSNGGTPLELIHILLEGFSPNILEEKEVSYRCYCSEEKTEKILISLGEEELTRMMEEDPYAEVACHFCDKKYKINISDILAEIRQNKVAGSP